MHGPHHRQRVIGRRSYEKDLVPGRILRQRLEHLRDGFGLQPLPAHVAHHSNDGKPRAVGLPRAKLDSPADRIAVGPQAASHRIVDDRDARSIGPVLDGKEAPSEQGSPERGKEPVADLVYAKPQAPGGDSGVPFGGDDRFRVAGDEQIANHAGALDAGERFDLFEHVRVEIDPLRGCNEGVRREIQHKHPLGPESGIDACDMPPASDQEAGAGHQNNRKGKLRHHESAADPAGDEPARDASSTLVAGGPQVPAEHRDRGRQSNEDSCDEGNRQRPAEHAQIEARLIQTSEVGGPKGSDQANACQCQQ